MDLSEVLKALSDPNRLRIVNLLGEGPLCVCDLEEVLAINQSNLSRHLAKLKQVGLVTPTKKGQFMYYARRPLGTPDQLVVDAVYATLLQDATWNHDREALAARKDCC